MICEFIDQMRSEGHAVESICRGLRKAGLQIAARTYREWTSPQRVVAARTVSDAEVEDTVRKLVWQPDGQGRRKMQPAGLYGRRKMLAEVRRAGLTTASPGAVDRVMRTLGLSGVLRSKKVYTTSSDPDGVRAPDLVDRDFTSAGPGSSECRDHIVFADACPPRSDLLWGGDQQRLDLADHGHSGFDGAAAHGQQHADLFDKTVASLGHGQRLRVSQCLLRSSVGIDRVGFPTSSLRASGTDDLADIDLPLPEVSGESGAIGTRALYPNELDDSERPEIGQERVVAGSGCWDLSIAEPPAARVEDCDVVGINVRVDSSHDVDSSCGLVEKCCHDEAVPSSRGHTGQGPSRQDVDGADQARMKSCSPLADMHRTAPPPPARGRINCKTSPAAISHLQSHTRRQRGPSIINVTYSCISPIETLG